MIRLSLPERPHSGAVECVVFRTRLSVWPFLQVTATGCARVLSVLTLLVCVLVLLVLMVVMLSLVIE